MFMFTLHIAKILAESGFLCITRYKPKINFGIRTLYLTLIHNFGLEASPCIEISEGRPPLCNTRSEAGALHSEVRIDFENDSSLERFFFWIPLGSTFHDTLFINSRKYFFGF